MVADRVLDLGRLGLGPAVLADTFLEILVKDRDRRDFDIDAPGLEVGIRDCTKLRRDALHAQALIAEVFSGEHIYLGERSRFICTEQLTLFERMASQSVCWLVAGMIIRVRSFSNSS